MAELRLAVFASLFCFTVAEHCDADMSSFQPSSLLQTSRRHKQTSSWTEDAASWESCELPEFAKWCKVDISGTEPFHMAVYQDIPGIDSHDYVSAIVCQSGRWEDLDMAALGDPGHALDIGGNIGYYTFVLANAGWNVTTFEPLDKNVQLMEATLCVNPWMKPQITIHHVGLGADPQECQILSNKANVGDGWVRCGEDAKKEVPASDELRQTFQVKRLDDMLSLEAVPKVDFLKIDVEGFECQVFAGGSKLMEVYKPRLVHTEVQGDMQGCEPASYLNMLRNNGYKIASDQACNQADADVPSNGGFKDFWVCREVEATSFVLQAGSGLTPPFKRHRMLLKLGD